MITMQDFDEIRENIEKIAKEAEKEGAIYSILFIDVHGPSAEDLKKIITAVANKIAKEKGVVLSVGKVEESIKQGDLYSSTVEVHLITASLPDLIAIVMKYTPMSIDIINPEEFNLSVADMNDLLLTISNYEYNTKQYIMNRVSNEEDKKRFAKEIEARKKLGEHLLKSDKDV